MYIDDIKLFAKNEKEFEALIQMRIYSQDIRMEFDIEKWAMFIMKIGHWQIMEGIELPNQESQNIWRKGKLWKLNKKSTSGKSENFPKPKSEAEISSKQLTPGQFLL